ncbi:hypothetical protein [Deinococcus sp. QL22]|uniref:hypothetical protein n=1 Tax=Deinococcus sp. QL22 TaxID=2939437 RepID=UPI002016FCBF|nr:hypothetical protein [Deinococcus sp. QL22]UQN09229.1 hypothetical protein M1R55_24685 [Deinococcus sp. QL22]
MYRIRRTDFPTNQTAEVPRYRIDVLKDQHVELTPEGSFLQVNLAAFDSRSLIAAMGMRREGREIRGLIAVNAVSFANALRQASAAGTPQELRAVVEDDWYVLAPFNLYSTPRAGEDVVIGLYR